MPVIKELLKNEIKRIGKRAFCRKSQIGASSIDNYLSDVQIPEMRTINKMAAYFKKPILYFFTDYEQEPKKPFYSENNSTYSIPLYGFREHSFCNVLIILYYH